MRVEWLDVVGGVGVGVLAAGLWGLWGWPAAAVAVGLALVAVAVLAARAGQGGGE